LFLPTDGKNGICPCQDIHNTAVEADVLLALVILTLGVMTLHLAEDARRDAAY